MKIIHYNLSLSIRKERNYTSLKMLKASVKSVTIILIATGMALFNTACHFKTKSFQGTAISIPKVYTLITDTNNLKDNTVLDVRKRMDYIRGHLGPALWIASDSLKTKLNTLDKQKPIIVYDSTSEAGAKAASFLVKNGFQKVYFLEGGIREWIKDGFPVAIRLVENTSPKLTVHPENISEDKVYRIVKQHITDYVVIDVRSPESYAQSHIRSAISIPYVPLNDFVVKLAAQNYPKNKPLIVYCVGHTCNEAKLAADVLLRNYYTHVYILGDGIEGWMSKGYPTDKSKSN